MAVIRPFRAVRPVPPLAEKVAALPYDVMNSAEAREMVQGNPHSFLHVDKAEIDLPEGTDLYSDEVYGKARDNIRQMIADGVLAVDEKRCFYIYRLVMNGHEQNGLVVTTSIDDYADDVIKKHEFTRAAKEKDRIRHVDTTDYHTGPIFLTYIEREEVDRIVADWQSANEPVYDFTAEDGVEHVVWVLDDDAAEARLVELFAAVDHLYIADGHHRAASAVKVGFQRREANPDLTGEEEYNYFLSVLFPANQLEIMDYNRVLRHRPANLTEALAEHFDITEVSGDEPYRPQSRHEFGMYDRGHWYQLVLKDGIADESDPVGRLDVALLQRLVLQPLFGIEDPRTSDDVDFVGGIRGLKELEKRCSEDMEVAFALHPTSLQELIDIANTGEVMPPKSTWFEPKMRSGLFLHSLTD